MTIAAKLQGFILPAILIWLDFTCISFGSPVSHVTFSKTFYRSLNPGLTSVSSYFLGYSLCHYLQDQAE